jgi:uncharacterized protein (DUF2147 family)
MSLFLGSVVSARFAALLLVASAVSAGAPGQQRSAVGFWNTISDTDGRPTAVVEIRDSGSGELTGVVRQLLVPATHEDSICAHCRDERKDQPVVGMEILRHMKPDGDGAWSGGEILDPQNGKTYRAKMKLTDGGAKLSVRGYIGVSLFGRSQTWIRR